MKRNISIILVIFLAVVSGCAKDTKKLSEDAALASEAYKQITLLREAYEKRDTGAIKSIASPVSDIIVNAMYFSAASLDFERQLVRITSDTITVAISWKGTWKLSSGQETQDMGIARFTLNIDNMTVQSIDGNNPFTAYIAGRQ